MTTDDNATVPANPPATRDELFALLDELGIATTTVEHAAVFTVEESDEVTAAIPGGHTKNLFVKDKKSNHFLIIAENVAPIPMNRIHSRIGAKGRLSFANADRLMELLGVLPGSVTAFSAMNDRDGRVQVVIDEPLLRFEQINCHPLTNTATTTISREDLLRFLRHTGHDPMVTDLSGQGEGGDMPGKQA